MALDPTIDVIDDRFRGLILMNVKLEQLWSGGRWTEGPVYVPAGRYLVFSDIPNDRTLRYDEPSDQVLPFSHPAGNQNGHCLDREGRMVSCEHRTRSVTRIEHDGSTTVIADSVDGRRLNSPNDVIVASDGGIWFTDPTYGIDSDYEGEAAPSEIGASNVYRVDPVDGSVATVITDMVQPNGLAFSADGSTLYVADTGFTHRGAAACPPVIRSYPMVRDGDGVARPDAGAASVFATCEGGAFDGFRIDAAGNLWTSAGAGVNCYHPDGTLLGRIHLPEIASNVEFGGPRRNRLYICATTSLYAIFVNTSASSGH